MHKYLVDNDFSINVGFVVTSADVEAAIKQTNTILDDLPASLFRSIDFKTTSAVIGAVFCDTVASLTKGIVNPIEKGHPDIIPAYGAGASEEQLRKFPEGLEIKCTVGNIQTGANLRAGQNRINKLTGITWQAHHREVQELMGLVWDFVDGGRSFSYPTITGVFYSNQLEVNDWGAISGTTGRNTKVTGMAVSGKQKMGLGWVALLDDDLYLDKFRRFLKVTC
mgnify:CR=1 FL=1